MRSESSASVSCRGPGSAAGVRLSTFRFRVVYTSEHAASCDLGPAFERWDMAHDCVPGKRLVRIAIVRRAEHDNADRELAEREPGVVQAQARFVKRSVDDGTVRVP